MIPHHIQVYPVSIHALLAECDILSIRYFVERTPFQSTHSLRSATNDGHRQFSYTFVSIHALLAECDFNIHKVKGFEEVSIHALLAECDKVCLAFPVKGHCFNPRTPCGVRLFGYGSHAGPFGFNPRTPCGVRRESGYTLNVPRGFNPRTPCGVRRLTRASAES